MAKKYKLVVNVPSTHANAVRKAIGDAGAGCIGNYTHCTFTTRGIGRYKGNAQSNPYIGKAGEYEQAEEEQIEAGHISATILPAVIAAMKQAHPYEETAYEIIELVDLEDLQ